MVLPGPKSAHFVVTRIAATPNFGATVPAAKTETATLNAAARDLGRAAFHRSHITARIALFGNDWDGRNQGSGFWANPP